MKSGKNQVARTKRPQQKYNRLRRHAKQRGRTNFLQITKDEYVQFIKGKVCHYCQGQLPAYGHGLDRLDNRIGYTMSNIVACCWNCNTIKGMLERIGFTYPRSAELTQELLNALKRVM